MSAWYFVLAPVAALAVLALIRFVGCASLLGIEDWENKGGPSGPDYVGTVHEMDAPVSYWRLQEKHVAEPSPGPTVPNTPIAGGIAKDEMGQNPGTYKSVMLQEPAPPPLPPDSPAAPGSLTLEAEGLLELSGQQSTSVTVDGGYVEVPFSNSFLDLSSFSVEALVRPEWSAGETGLYRSVVTFCTVDVTPNAKKAFGFGLFAGPDPANSSSPDVWQIWLGDGTDFKPFKDPLRPLTLVDFVHTNYLLVTYDDASNLLNMYVYIASANCDLDSPVVHPLKDVSVTAYSPVADPTQSLLIGMHRPPIGSGVSGPFPVYHPFKGRIQEVALYDKSLSIGRACSHVSASLNL